jgi:hypothetical protein
MELSQKTLVRLMEVLAHADSKHRGDARYTYWFRLLYEYEFPEWFIRIAAPSRYFNWDDTIRELRSRSFFFGSRGPILSADHLEVRNIPVAAEYFLEKLAAIAVIRIAPDHSLDSDQLLRSIVNDGFTLNQRKADLDHSEGEVSLKEEESGLALMIEQSGLSRKAEAKTHLRDAGEQYLDGTKDHPSLNESRSLFQSLLDQICEEVDRSGQSSIGLPGNTKSRLDYLETNGIWTNDERMMFGAGWGFLSAGGHPGLTPREQARIGLLLSIEFSSILILAWHHWKQTRP